MNFERKIIWQHITPHYNRSLLQPLAVALVCAIFIGLFLTMGIIDLQRSERILQGFMEDQGMRIVGVVERLTDENMKTMILASQKASGNAFVPLTEQVISPQLFLTDKIVAMAREIDNHWKKEHLSAGYIRRYAEEKNLWYLAVLNAWGQVIYQSRELGDAAPASGAQAKLKAGRPATAAELFARLGTLNRSRKIGFIALSRKDGSGTIIIALDQNSARYWGKRVAVEKAIEKLGEGQGQGLVYLTVVDTRGMPLAYAGNPPEGWDREKRSSDSELPLPVVLESRNANYSGKRILEIVTPLRLSGKPAGVIRLGLDRGNTDQIINENRRNMFVFLAFVVLIALLSMWLLYHNQNRHLAGILKMERQLEKAERLSALGQLAAGVAHEIRNPLNAISMASQRLKRECVPADEEKKKEFEGMAGVIRDEIRRLNAIIEEFLTFAKSRRLVLRDCPLQDLLQKILLLISTEAAAKGIELKTEARRRLVVRSPTTIWPTPSPA